MTRFGTWAFGLHGLIACCAFAHAHDAHQHPSLVGWAEEQILTPEAGKRFACPEFSKTNNSCYCCHGSEIVKTKFRPIEVEGIPYPQDGWQWLNPATNEWEQIPDDIIHWGEPTPTREAVLFVFGGKKRCFFPPDGGG